MNRRSWMSHAAGTTSALLAQAGLFGRAGFAHLPDDEGEQVAREARDFIFRCRRPDGGYAASPDPTYAGESDAKHSDLAAVTYAAVLARTMGWELPQVPETIDFVRGHQEPDGRFVNQGGLLDPESDHAMLYNTTQGTVALRALGAMPEIDPTSVVEPMLKGDAFKRLPWYMTSFFPLLYAALGKPFPVSFAEAIAGHMEASQAEDGYLGDHVASSFHMAHFYRLLGRPTPKADLMVARVLRDQARDGGWNIKEPDWDVHACFDALFVLNQLGGDTPEVRNAMSHGADWALRCRNSDGGFGHFPGWHSDMDAVYFQLGALIQAGRLPGARRDLLDAHTLGWGHAMRPGVSYENQPLARA